MVREQVRGSAQSRNRFAALRSIRAGFPLLNR